MSGADGTKRADALGAGAADWREAIATALDAAMERTRVPGVAVGVLHAGEEALLGRGVTSVEHPLPVDERTLFQIASLSKPFTATALLRLVDDGKLELEQPVRELLPDFRLPEADQTDRIRVADLLSHSGGWDGDRFFVEPPSEPTLEAVVAEFASNRQLVPPHTDYSYNNAGFSVAGRLIEVLSGQPFETALRELVLDPLGMGHSYLRADAVVTHRVAAPHVVGPDGPVVLRGGGWQPGWELLPSDAPAGGLVSCTSDLLRWARFHLGDGRNAEGERLLRAETLERMRRETAPGGCGEDAIGLPWLLHDWGGRRFFGHTGHTSGYLAEITLQHEAGFALVVLTNSVNDGRLRESVRDRALAACLGVRREEPPAVAAPADREAYAGRYDHAFAILEVRAGEAPDELIVVGAPRPLDPARWQPPPPPATRLVFIGPDRLRAVDPEASRGDRCEFGRGAEGRVAWLRFGGRIAPRLP